MPSTQRPRLLAAVESSHFGPIVAISDDLGATWHKPDEPPIAFPEGSTSVPSAGSAGVAGPALKRVWRA